MTFPMWLQMTVYNQVIDLAFHQMEFSIIFYCISNTIKILQNLEMPSERKIYSMCS